jgi:hypothetical protein
LNVIGNFRFSFDFDDVHGRVLLVNWRSVLIYLLPWRDRQETVLILSR